MRVLGGSPAQEGGIAFPSLVNRVWLSVKLVSLSLSQMFSQLQEDSFLEYTDVIFLFPLFPTVCKHPIAAGFNEHFESQLIPN